MPTFRFKHALACVVLVLACVHAFGARATTEAAAPPEIFAPGVISGPAHDSAPAFTADGDTVYFSRSNPVQSTILVSHRMASHGNESWSTPQAASFSGEWNDMEPALAPDGSCLVFVSNRPARAGEKPVEARYGGDAQKGGNFWRVDRKEAGWGTPRRLPDAINANTTTFAPAIAADGSVWFMTTDPKTAKFRLYRSQFHDGAFEPARPLPFSDGTSTDVDPVVAPDESFVVFGSARIPKRGIDLFITFHDGGRWGEPIHLGNVVNSIGSDAEPRLGPDRRMLYFSSERTVPVMFPRSRAQATADVARMQAWDNGNYNIWRVSLAPWLDAHAHDMAAQTGSR
jgi:Tol biopolymer transport system component